MYLLISVLRFCLKLSERKNQMKSCGEKEGLKVARKYTNPKKMLQSSLASRVAAQLAEP